MKKKNYIKTMVMALVILTSCKKSSRVDEKFEPENYADVIVQAEMVANEMEFLGRYLPGNIIQYPDDGNYLEKGKIARKGTTTGQEITIDFGAGSICTDGKFRSGKLIIEFNETNFDTMIRPQTYKLGDIDVRGNYSIGYVVGSNQLRLNFIVLNGKLNKQNRYMADFTLSRKSEFTQGATTQNDLLDDVFTHTELAYDLTMNANGRTSLLRARGIGESKLGFSCSDRYYPTTGQLRVDFTGLEQGSFRLTFGNGSCNDRPVID